MNNKHLICMGFAKCGTTLLNYLLGQTNEFIIPSDIKEIRYFLPYKFKNNINNYLSYYHKNTECKLTNKVFFEATPAYLHTSWEQFKKITANIKGLIKNPKILICLRHPIYRSFSHYIHNINAHFSYRGFSYNNQPGTFKSIYKNSFFDYICNERNIVTKYFNKIKYLESIFGLENIAFFVIEKDLHDFDKFYKKLCDFLDIEYNSYFINKDIPRVGSGKLVAQYLYADENDLIIQSKDSCYRLDKGSLLICNDLRNMICKNLDSKLAYEVSNSQHLWTKNMTSILAKKLTKFYFADDIKNVSELIKDYCDISFYNDYTFKDINIELSKPNHAFMQKKLTKVF